LSQFSPSADAFKSIPASIFDQVLCVISDMVFKSTDTHCFEGSVEDLLEAVDDGIIIFAGGGESAKCNSRFLELWEMPLELLGSEKKILDFILGQLVNHDQQIETVINPADPLEVKIISNLLLKNGRVFDLISKPISAKDSSPARAWIVKDMAAAGKPFKTIQDQLKLLNRIIHTLPDLIWVKDPGGVYLACNRRFEDFFNVAEQEVVGKIDFDFMTAELAQSFRAHDQAIISNGFSSIHEEWTTSAMDGHREFLKITKIPMYDDSRQPIGLLGIGHNITARRASEMKLKESEERFSLAMRGANDGLWDWNLETDEVYYSPRWRSMLGYGEAELEGTLDTWKNLVHADDRDVVLAKVKQYAQGILDSFEVEMRMRHKQGHEVFVLSRAFLVKRDSDGKAVRLVGTHVDITDRKKAEQFNERHAGILEMVATGKPAAEVYREIALMYEERHPGMRCSMLELQDGKLMHGGAPSLPKEYCEAVHGLRNGPNVGSCGTSTYTGQRVLVEDIATDPKWANIKQAALSHGLRCCWSEPIKNSSGTVLGAFGMYYNHPALPNEEESNDLRSAARLAGIVMERDQAQKRIHELAYTDELTRLANRTHFYQTLEKSIKTAQRQSRQFGILYIDLDDFKSVNDSLGHDAGDLLLKEIAQRLKRVSRDADFAARLSGDEFCILVEDIEDVQVTSGIAQRCLEAISQPVELSGRKFTPACSIGIAHYPDDGQTASTLIKSADTSLYAAKERGKNQYVFHQPELTHKAEYRFQVEQNLRNAVENQQFSLVYQPQIQIRTGEIIGVEALCRWHHPRLGQVAPHEFIHIAERTGMIKPLTEWVLNTACRQAVAWKRAGFPALRMAVNISPSHFLDQDFVPMVERILGETGMMPTELELEVTEHVVQTHQQNLSIFQALKDLGVLLSIDDFGTGYSSFASLKHLTFDHLKIDKYFIDDMLVDFKSRLLVGAMIEMGHNLDHGLIAEGVETAEQYHLLRKLGCETAQGYLFSPPVSADEISNRTYASSIATAGRFNCSIR
jgi:diguanylate cyclase (GGDEF)-like protein/PAS domain S-box-containing protein